MQNPKYDGHRDAAATGGRSQSQKEHTCPRCGMVGKGNGWLGRHIKKGYKCSETYNHSIVSKFEEIKRLLNEMI